MVPAEWADTMMGSAAASQTALSDFGVGQIARTVAIRILGTSVGSDVPLTIME
eukprot:gene499-11852_t